MTTQKWRCLVPLAAIFFITAFFATCIMESVAHARAGSGRSSGSRGSRTAYSPAKPSLYPAMNNPSRNLTFPAPQPVPQRNGFWRTFAGGMAGGLLGGFLFSSLGFGGHGGGFGGGIGIVDIILLSALLYFIYWFIKRRKTTRDHAAEKKDRHT